MHSTVPAPSAAMPGSKTPAPTAQATWSWPPSTTLQPSSIVPAMAPVGSGSENISAGMPAASRISRLQERADMSKAIVRAASE